jgi:hypothetical protein
MDQDRNLGVTEARFALTLLTCILVAVGYIALLRLGGTKEPQVDVGPHEVLPPTVAVPSNPPDAEPQPRVLPLEPDDGRKERTQISNRNAPPNPSSAPERR